ncbi:glycoside hydrolase family 95-like protein [Flavihumibacter sp. CACIAM 22H1]|uniref:glycoside hydrolase family 95-like protein n=1 Tax=Flavihumibacter sp. CACIAM 22H1 TaxID=1812911 RepID=UPI0007A89ACE|nr:hypothetical protein [Flavihumibacter sp. CACIAM 22H1]KYP13128.1 MAG: hypothetical protein A1D16_20930 [Flavihumibacter sp. CACIAM 22H1]
MNGDQTGKGYSGFRYRPFTLEGNFAYASGLQDMLLQSQMGYIDVFPAVPESWQDCSFRNFRTRGAFLVDAERLGGQLNRLVIRSEKGGSVRVKLGTGHWQIRQQQKCTADLSESGWLSIQAAPGGVVEVRRQTGVRTTF